MTAKNPMRGPSPPNPGPQVRSPLPNVVSSTKQGAEGLLAKPAKLWRNKFHSPLTPRIVRVFGSNNGCEDPFEFLLAETFATAELAEQKAIEWLTGPSCVQLANWMITYRCPVPAGDA